MGNTHTLHPPGRAIPPFAICLIAYTGLRVWLNCGAATTLPTLRTSMHTAHGHAHLFNSVELHGTGVIALYPRCTAACLLPAYMPCMARLCVAFSSGPPTCRTRHGRRRRLDWVCLGMPRNAWSLLLAHVQHGVPTMSTTVTALGTSG